MQGAVLPRLLAFLSAPSIVLDRDQPAPWKRCTRTPVTRECGGRVRVASVIGARPQFIKAWPVSRELRGAGHVETIVHTGQHYDEQMSDVFFAEMGIPRPDHFLEIGSGSHGDQTGRMLMAVEQTLIAERPDWVLVYGDTNTTLAAAIAACKLGVRLAHIEAGLGSTNRSMLKSITRMGPLFRLLLVPRRRPWTTGTRGALAGVTWWVT